MIRFFTRILRYHSEKGFAVIVTSRVLNLLTLAFTVLFTAALLLLVDWGVLLSDCPEDAGGGEHCELAAMGVLARPFRSNSPQSTSSSRAAVNSTVKARVRRFRTREVTMTAKPFSLWYRRIRVKKRSRSRTASRE